MIWLWVITALLIISELQKLKPAKLIKKTKSFYQSTEWKRLRYKVLCHYEATCMCCGASRISGAEIHVDHILPRSLFPDLALDFNNMQVLCRDCNLAKSNTDSTDWRQPLEG